MSTLYSIIVENKSPFPQEFYFFQKPAQYSGGVKVFSNSLGNFGLPAYTPGTNSQLPFKLLKQYYAGVQKQMAPPTVGHSQIGQVSQADIDIASASGNQNTKDGTTVIIDDERHSIYLTPAINTPGTQLGAFRITTPPFNPIEHKINVGLSIMNHRGEILLSSFAEGQPNKHIDVQPIVKFYVNTGSYKPGTVVNFTTSSVNAAVCNATDGQLFFKVVYNADGTFTVS